jgi:hypothetical protein
MLIDPKTYNIMRTLCPCAVGYKEYGCSTIPTDVLMEIKKCVDNGWYSEIQVMYDNKTPDPFVVGINKDSNGWQIDRHLIARWGAELIPFEMLESKAIDRQRNDVITSLEELKHQTEAALKNPDVFIAGLLANKTAPSFRMSYSGSLSF